METKAERKKSSKILAILKTIYTFVTSLAVLSCLLASTYAWFSSNSVVKTNRVSGSTASDQVMLQVSQTGGDGFQGLSETALIQVNRTNSLSLLPVSTADLQHFVYSPNTVEESAVHFLRVENEKYYYHGRFYVKAAAEGHSENARLALYLDGASNGGSVAGNVKGYLANAARLGLLFDGGNARILRVSEAENPAEERVLNTVLSGVTLTAGQVIDSSQESLRAVTDPSEALGTYMVGENGLPGAAVKPLLTMELNRVYMVDVFFYLEGCDPDCSDVTRMDEMDLHLSFYGVLMEGEVR